MSYAYRPSEPKCATTILPSVAGVAEAWLDFGWRFVLGTPSCATFSQSTLPVFLSRQSTRHECEVTSFDGSTSPKSPWRKTAFGSLLTAVVTNSLSPHTIGLETARPGIAVFQRTPSPLAASHFSGAAKPSATPDATGPRNDGQSTPGRALSAPAAAGM